MDASRSCAVGTCRAAGAHPGGTETACGFSARRFRGDPDGVRRRRGSVRAMTTTPRSESFSAAELGEQLGLSPDEIQPYGRYAAKIELSALERLSGAPDGKLVCRHVGDADEGRRGQDDDRDLARRGARPDRRAARCSASASPRSARSSGSRAAAPAAAARSSRRWSRSTCTSPATSTRSAPRTICSRRCSTRTCCTGTSSGIDPHSITWRRCLDMDDRALRQVVVGLGGRVNGSPARPASTSRPPPR